MTHGHGMVGNRAGASGAIPSVANAAAAAKGTVMLSSIPNGSVSAMAAAIVAAIIGNAMPATPPNSAATPKLAAPPASTNASRPPQLLVGFHGSGASGMARPASVAVPSPNASNTHPMAASSMCQLKVTISTPTATG